MTHEVLFRIVWFIVGCFAGGIAGFFIAVLGICASRGEEKEALERANRIRRDYPNE